MGFIQKTTYENIYEWVKSEKGTCFYCYEDKSPAIVLIGDNRGICQECIDSFKIGHFGADRHVIGHLCNATTHKSAVAWIKKHGGKLEFTRSEDVGYDGKVIMCHFYNGINKDDASNPVEISDDGSIHIIY